MEKRNEFWDSLKFILIVLVVYGHLLEQSPSCTVNRAIFNFIYMFHMPLFVLISGRFSHINNKATYKKKIVELLETFFVFQLIWSFVDYIFMKETSLIRLLLIPRWTLWYLLSLIFWRITVLLLTEDFLMHHKKSVIFSSFAISIIGGFIPVGGIFSLQRTITFLPFFVMGYYLIACDIEKKLNRVKGWVALLFLILLFSTIYFYLNFPLGVILTGNKYYLGQTVFPPDNMCFYRTAFLIIATLTSICFMKLCDGLFKHFKFSSWGRYTLIIYMFHTFVVKGIRLFKYNYDISFFNSDFSMPIVAVVIVLGLTYIAKLKVFRFLLNPISTLSNN